MQSHGRVRIVKNKPVSPDWIGVDWGTTHLRAWAMTKDGDCLAEVKSDRGMRGLAADEFETTLQDVIADWIYDRVVPVIICGMAGSRQGWVETHYSSVPCPAVTAEMVFPKVSSPGISVSIIPGVMQKLPPDVMRGEETQIAGFLHLNPSFDGILCLPGTHTKWVRISEGLISAFRTTMTGEIFDCLTHHTVLRHSTAGDGWDDDAFATAIGDAISRPERLATDLFSLRADSLLNATPPDVSRARLSGTLIGIELASVRSYWLGQSVTLIGAEQLCGLYAKALAFQGVEVALSDGRKVTQAGLFAAFLSLKVPSA
jgi:2-dehydro-3-deoxygalactonokinase